MKAHVLSMFLLFALIERGLAGPVRSVCSGTFQSAMPSGPVWDSTAVKGQWFLDPRSDRVHAKTMEFHDDENPLSINGVVQNIIYDGSPASNIVAFSVLATVTHDLPAEFPPNAGSNSHAEVQSPQMNVYTGTLHQARITAEFAVADIALLPAGIIPYYPDPVSRGMYFIEAVNEDELAWYCWTPDDPQHLPSGNFQVPAWILGDIPAGGNASVLMEFQVRDAGGMPAGIPMHDYRHSVIRFSGQYQADLLYNRSASLKISHWLDTLLIDYGSYITAPPGNYEEPPPEYIHASDGSVFFDPEMDFGDAPDPTYPTLLVNDGARHIIVPGIQLGALIDAEPDGQPDANAKGDDKQNLADEDGVTFTAPLIPGQTASVNVTCLIGGFLSAWIDFDGNGGWGEPGEQIFAVLPLVPGMNALSFVVPVTAKNGPTFARFRFTTRQTAISFTGLVEDGEVEDYEVQIRELDFGDAWDSLATPSYPTFLVHNGARHIIVPGVYLGALIDAEQDGQPDPNAQGDDNFALDDEDGVNLPPVLIAGSTVNVQVTASVPGYLNAWMDWNANGNWIDPGEHVYSNAALNAGLNTLALPVPSPPALVSGGPHTRWRFTTYAPAVPSFLGLEDDGEVEDYHVQLQVLDLGDAPAPYPTLLSQDGARHLMPSAYWLGPVPPDHEPDGQPHPQALGDDTSGASDEDGVAFGLRLVRGSNVAYSVQASTSGYLNAWMDFNRNGSWGDAGDQIATDVILSPGVNALSVSVPSNAMPGQTFGRFRFSQYAGLAPAGVAYDGEVEDYAIAIYQTGPSTNIVITNIACIATSGVATIQWIGESPVVYEAQYADKLETNTAWTSWGGYVVASPYEQTDTSPSPTLRVYRVTAPYTAP